MGILGSYFLSKLGTTISDLWATLRDLLGTHRELCRRPVVIVLSERSSVQVRMYNIHL